jgi:dTMP kinase
MLNDFIIPARFISFEGIDGCGKTTLLAQLSAWLEGAGIAHIKTREPGGTVLGERIRDLLLDPSHGSMDQRAEVFLYTASRSQLAQEVIVPALQRGLWVLADRYIDATLAYQGFGRGLDLERLHQIQEWATHGLWPHHTILVDCDVDIALTRLNGRQENPDRMEQEERAFHQRVRDGYLELARSEPLRFLILDGSKDQAAVIGELRKHFWQPFCGED